MATVDEYIRMAEEAVKDGAHVAVLMYYRTAIEEAGYHQNAAEILLAAVQYAQRLKKERDKTVVTTWSREALGRIQANLKEIIEREIKKLETGDVKNAT